MPTDFVFRLSMYLTLALSCVCLGYAERSFLPEVPFIAGAVIISLVVFFRLETRIQLLTIPDANRVGLVLGMVYLGWAAVRVVREIGGEGETNLEWQMLLVAMVGPLLMLTMPAKLARREKHAGDFWWFHGAALAAAGLSGAIAPEGITFVLISLYAVCALWSLRLLHLRLAAGKVPAIPGRPTQTRIVGVVGQTSPRRGLRGALLLLALGLVIAVPLYLVTPRSQFARLEFGKTQVRIGYAADQMLDLNQTGELAADDAIAFRVRAELNGRPHTSLSPDQRWRGRVLRQYVGGGWQRGDMPLPPVWAAFQYHALWSGQVGELLTPALTLAFLHFRRGEPIPERAAPWTSPQLRPDQVTLTFTVPRDLLGEFLADPVVWVPGTPIPIATLTPAGPDSWYWVGDGSFFWDAAAEPEDEPLHYVQVWHPPQREDASPALHLGGDSAYVQIRPLLQNPVPRVKEYTDALLDRMIAAGQLPANCRDRISLLPRWEHHDQIARAFTHHLATTPELQYTTNLRRDRKDVDPIEDFLFHTRAGHCERFATALVLMLRSQGIPAVLVLGFKGSEATDVPGEYVVRQQHAHAWVDALVPAPGQPGNRDPLLYVYHWRSLDPTPAGSAAPETPKTRLGEVRSWLRSAYNEYLVNYSRERQRQALTAIGNQLSRPEVLAILGGVALALLFLRRQRRRREVLAEARTSYPPHVEWFTSLLKLLAAHGITPQPGQTAREFCLAAGEQLRQHPQTTAVAEVPIVWADAYYEARFGDNPVPPQQLAELQRGLTELEIALGRTPKVEQS